jgi:CBS domain containing-hemolysin-like protein
MVPLTKKVDEMLDFFGDNEVQAAVVLNEFGGVDGFVTMRRVLAFVFGQIAQGRRAYQEVADNVFEVAGDLKLNQFNDVTNFGISDPRMTTIGGVVLRKLDRLPREGDEVTVDDVLITVLEMTGHRIARVRAARGVSRKQTLEADKVNAEADADEQRR